MYYLNSRYYDPELGRFINADDISILNEAKEFPNGLNLYSYCNNNPVNLTDENGNAWWHWLIAALLVVVSAIAVVVTAGGAIGAIAAIGAVLAGGSAATMGATIAAGIFIGTTVTFSAFSIFAGIEAINNDSLDTFLNYGESAIWATAGGGILGGFGGYLQYKANNYFTGTKTPGKSTPYSTYRNTKGQTITHYDKNGFMSWSKHLTNHNRPWSHTAPHWHLEMPHSEPGFNSRWTFIKAFLKRLLKR